MYKFRNALIGLISVLSLVAIATVSVPHIGRGAISAGSNAPTNQTQNVNVVNTPSVNVANFPATTNVAIDPSANTVKIDTANPLLVRDVENSARQPFHNVEFGGFEDGANFTGFVPITTVPAGKRLVIEYCSLIATMPVGQTIFNARIGTQLLDSNNGSTLYHVLTVSAQGSDGLRDFFSVSQELRLYADPGTTVFCAAQRSSPIGSNPGSFGCAISGYFVSLP
jgi:hypothetical protein